MSMNRFLETAAVRWVALFSVFLAAVAAIFVWNASFYNEFLAYFKATPAVSLGKNTAARVTIDFGNGKKRAFEGDVMSPISAAEALRAASTAGRFSLNMALSGEISDINGVRELREKGWRWYLNGEPQLRPMPDVLIRGGDKILLKYE